MTDLLYSEIEEDLRATVRSLLVARTPWPDVIKRTESDATYDAATWRALAYDLGVAGLIIPERFGGAGASYREAAVVLEETGRACAPVPYLGSAVIATTALLACAGEAADLLSALASGERTAALVVPFSQFTAGVVSVVANDGQLTGTVTSVADALPADLLLVPAAGGLYAIDATAAGVTATPVVSLDMTRQLADITFDGAAARRISRDATGPVAKALIAGAALLASEQLGVASWCLETTVEYMKGRYQFGRPIGSFQALKHRVADIWVDVTQARAVARYAAGCAADDDADLPVAASLAQAFTSAVAVRAAEEALQLHGGIGFTWEYPVHLYLKRAKSASIGLGTATAHRAALAHLVDLPFPVL